LTSSRCSLFTADAPQLVELLGDIQSKAEELRQKIAPLVATVKEGGLPTSSGVSFLEVKYQLLLSYVSHILCYLLLKLEGKSVATHPVMDQLHHIRCVNVGCSAHLRAVPVWA
jgi:hypothetical protein